MFQSNVSEFPVRRGKVRDMYEVDKDFLVMVSTDRISAFDHVLPNPIPGKGKALTQITEFWANKLDVRHHIVTSDTERMPEPFRRPEFVGRTLMVERAEVIPFECIVRAYLCGGLWNDYRCGERMGLWHPMPPRLKQNMALPRPIFTPSTKAETGHDENICFEEMASKLGLALAAEIESKSVDLFEKASQYCWEKGIILADTKLEWGRDRNGELILVDEFFTQDSSRYWLVEDYAINKSLASYDKQPVRDYLDTTGWDKKSPPPSLPDYMVENVSRAYERLFEFLTSHSN